MAEHNVYFIVDNKTGAELRFLLSSDPVFGHIAENQDVIPPHTRKQLGFHRTMNRADLAHGYRTWMHVINDGHKEYKLLARPDHHGSHHIDLAKLNVGVDLTCVYTVENREGSMADIQFQLQHESIKGRV